MGVPLNIDWQQILLHLFNFVLLAGGLYFLLYAPVRNFMEKRTGDIAAKEKAAAEKEANAAALEAEYSRRLDEAKAEAEKTRAAAALEAEKEASAILADAKRQKERMLADARDAAAHEKERMIEDARGEIANLAVEATAKLLSEREAAEEAHHA